MYGSGRILRFSRLSTGLYLLHVIYILGISFLGNRRMPFRVRFIRGLGRIVPFGLFVSVATFLYTGWVTPYEIRYCSRSLSGPYEAVETRIVNASYSDKRIVLVFHSGSGEIHDVTFRPLLEETQEWSLRELLPSFEAHLRPFFQTEGAKQTSVGVLADRHLPGGLDALQRLFTSNLRFRATQFLDQGPGGSLSGPAKSALVNQFLALPDRHHADQLNFPSEMSRKHRSQLQAGLEQLHTAWEREVEQIREELLQRWQAASGTTILFGASGFGAERPIELVFDLRKENALVLKFFTGKNASASDIAVSLGSGSRKAYMVRDQVDLEKNGLLLAMTRSPALGFSWTPNCDENEGDITRRCL